MSQVYFVFVFVFVFTAFVIHCPFEPEVAEFFSAVFKCDTAVCVAASQGFILAFRLEAHAKSHNAQELLELLISTNGFKRSQIVSLCYKYIWYLVLDISLMTDTWVRSAGGYSSKRCSTF